MSEPTEDTPTPPEESGEVKSDQDTSPPLDEAPSTSVGEPKTEGDEVQQGAKVTEQPPPAPAPKPKQYRYDWYQTERDVCINVMIKRVKKENVCVNLQETTVKVAIKLEDGGTYDLELNLAHPVVPEKSVTKVLNTKVEIKMRKCHGLHWQSLEASNTPTSQPIREPQKTEDSSGDSSAKKDDPVHKYPSSSHYTRDWDKVVAQVKDEEKNEKPEGDAALNQLFQQIYRDGNEEVRRAMNKSFVESGGTVLSTNWKEVGQDRVERKPPDGMEWKDYEN